MSRDRLLRRIGVLKLLLAVFVALPAVTANAAETDSELAVRAVKKFHERLAAGDAEGAAEQLGPTLFIGDERTTATDRLSAHFFRSGADLAGWPGGYLKQVGPHKNVSEAVSVSVRGNGAVVITRDTGSNAFRSWKNEEVAWFLGKTDGHWRIVSIIYRDIQLPK